MIPIGSIEELHLLSRLSRKRSILIWRHRINYAQTKSVSMHNKNCYKNMAVKLYIEILFPKHAFSLVNAKEYMYIQKDRIAAFLLVKSREQKKKD